MKQLKIPLIIALILLDIFIHLSAAQEKLDAVSISEGPQDEDRELLAGLDSATILAHRNNFVYASNDYEKQVKELSKHYGELINQLAKADTLEATNDIKSQIDAVEAHQQFTLKELAKLLEYIEELDYQLERNSPRA